MPMPQFYNMSEAAAKLGKSEDDVKDLIRDGKLREFRDRGQVFFKAEEVESLAGDVGGGTDETLSLDDSSVGGLALSDDSGLDDSSLSDSAVGASNAGGSAFGDSSVGDSALGDSAIGASHAGTSASTPAKSPDTGEDSSGGEYDLASDSSVGLSDSGSSFDLSDSAGGSPIDLADESVDATEEPDLLLDTGDSLTLKDDEMGEGDKGDTVITSVGISVFDDDEIEIDVDPMAKTQVQPSLEDQISLEGVGSGSGLLDLTRESDDTSLGAELLDEIYPGEEESTMQEDLPTEVMPGVTPTTPAPAAPGFTPAAGPGYAVVVPAAPPDPISVGFTGMMIVGVLMLSLTGTVLAAALQGVVPSFLTTLYTQWMAVAGGGVGLSVVALLIGWFVGKQMIGGGGPSKPKEPRKKKEKKKKKKGKKGEEEPEEPTEAEAGDDAE